MFVIDCTFQVISTCSLPATTSLILATLRATTGRTRPTSGCLTTTLTLVLLLVCQPSFILLVFSFAQARCRGSSPFRRPAPLSTPSRPPPTSAPPNSPLDTRYHD